MPRHYGASKMRSREQYVGYEETKASMRRDGNMIHENHAAPCLLPEDVIDRDWPRAAQYNFGYVDTLFTGVQKQLAEDAADSRRAFKPKKY